MLMFHMIFIPHFGTGAIQYDAFSSSVGSTGLMGHQSGNLSAKNIIRRYYGDQKISSKKMFQPLAVIYRLSCFFIRIVKKIKVNSESSPRQFFGIPPHSLNSVLSHSP